MKKNNLILLQSLLALAISSCMQEKKMLTLEATLTNIPDSTLFYLNPPSNLTLDSAYVVNGHLSMKGQLTSEHPEKLTLLSTVPEFVYTQLLVTNENITFSADIEDFPWNIDVSGSIHQDEFEKFNQIDYQKQRLTKELNQKYDSNKGLLSKKIKAMEDSLNLLSIEMIEQKINTYAALNKFKYHTRDFSSKKLKSLYKKLDATLRETPTGKAIKLMSEFPIPKIGDKYYDYRALSQNGDTLALSETENKYILLHFSSWACYGSQLSLPELKKLNKSYNDELQIVSISTDIDKAKWQEHVKRDSISWPYLWDGKGDYNEAFAKYRLDGTPYYVLISPDKIILEKWWGYGKGIFEEKVGKYINY